MINRFKQDSIEQHDSLNAQRINRENLYDKFISITGISRNVVSEHHSGVYNIFLKPVIGFISVYHTASGEEIDYSSGLETEKFLKHIQEIVNYDESFD